MTSTTTNNKQLTMEQINDNFESEVKEEWELYYEDYVADDEIDFDEAKDQFLQERYNSYEIGVYECKNLINNNLDIYLAMMEYCIAADCGEWDGNGIVRVVNMWKYLKAQNILGEIEKQDKKEETKDY